MFPSRRNNRISTALLEVAEAMLRPVPLEDELPGAGDDAWQWPARTESAAPHPHRRPARIDRPRRPGAPARPAQICTTPQPPRPQRERQATQRA